MANNKLYGLPNRIERTTMRDPTIKQKADFIDDHGQGIYMNTMAIAKGNTSSEDDKDHDYEILQHKLSPPKRNLAAEKKINHVLGVNGKEYRCVFVVIGGMMCALFFMVTGIAVALGVLHKTGKTYRLWSTWKQWSFCSASCDVGMRHRRRDCNETSSSENARYCIGDATEYQLCNDRACSVVNGGWSDWLAWGTCSTTCGTGLQTRHRSCSNPKPRNGGEHCFGETTDYKSCKLRTCPGIDGGWSEWSSWGTCSNTCEAGLQTRNRTCSNPYPNNGGEHCFGESVDYRSCNLRICPSVNGGWSSWTSWGTCSTTCGTGLQSRQRNCSNPRPSHDGEHCLGESTDYRSCHPSYCYVNNGYWSAWSSWTSCSSTCTKTRTRSCNTYSGGRQCLGNSDEKENCNLAGCASSQLRIRLSGSTNRLEVSTDGVDWGTVCDDNFGSSDARVACRMLGYSGYSVVSASSVSDGNGSIYLDELGCVGTESSLLECRHSDWGKHDCRHTEDVGVNCY